MQGSHTNVEIFEELDKNLKQAWEDNENKRETNQKSAQPKMTNQI